MKFSNFGRTAVRAAGLCALSVMAAGLVHATHFRYGHILWKARPDIATNTAEILLYASFRRGGYPGPPVIGSVITENIGATTLNLGDGTVISGPGGALQFKVLAFDVAQDWIYAVALNPVNANLPITRTYSGPGPWTAEISSCCRISTLQNAPDGNYRVTTIINFNTDVSSAVATVPPIVNCTSGPVCAFGVTAGDSDGDTLFWRLATGTENGGMTQPAGLTINSTTGALSWPTAGKALGPYGVQIVIESRTVGGAIKSLVAVDFIISLGSAPVGGTAPVFMPPTPVCGITLDLVVGKTFTFTVRAQDADAGDIVTLNAIGLPTGATMTPSLPSSANPIQSVFSWTPTVAQVATSVIIFTATDTTARQTQCNTILQVRADSDGDGIPDVWETNGYTYNGQFVNLPAMGANPNHKDIFIEIDYMVGLQPKQAAIDKVVAAFAAVPNSQFAIPNPDGLNGINLHIVTGNSVPFQANLGASVAGVYNWTAFEALKSANFLPALQLSYHYCLFANIGPTTATGGVNSGISRGIPSSDFLVTLGTWAGSGTVDEQAGTLMHEFGHNLGLGHGGPITLAVPAGQVNVNYKPNYLSVMNYTFQMSGLRKGANFGFFDYSRFALPTLNEPTLNETVGLNSVLANTYGTVWYCGLTRTIGNVANGPLDWDCSGTTTASVSADINKGAGTSLISYNDWANISYTGGSIGAGIPLEQPTTTPIDERTLQDSIDEPPAPPSGLTARTSGTLVRLAWNPLGRAGEFTYRVYRKVGTGPIALIDTVGTPAYSQTLASGTYQYYVTGVNGFNIASGPSTIVTLVIP